MGAFQCQEGEGSRLAFVSHKKEMDEWLLNGQLRLLRLRTSTKSHILERHILYRAVGAVFPYIPMFWKYTIIYISREQNAQAGPQTVLSVALILTSRGLVSSEKCMSSACSQLQPGRNLGSKKWFVLLMLSHLKRNFNTRSQIEW